MCQDKFKKWCKKRLQKWKMPTVAKREDVYIGLYYVILSKVMPQIYSSRMNGKWWHDIGLCAGQFHIGEHLMAIHNLQNLLKCLILMYR